MEKTAQMVAFYGKPADPEAFEKRYFEEHVPLVKKMPGLLSVSVHKFQKNLMGGELPYYMMATMVFESKDALKAAMGSPEGQATGANIMSFAGDILTLTTTEADTTELTRV